MTFSPDGLTLATGGADGSTRLWDVRTQLPIAAPFAQRDRIYAVKFAADGRHVLSTSHTGDTRVWPLPMSAQGDSKWLTQRLQLWTAKRLGEDREMSHLSPDDWRQLKYEVDPESALSGRSNALDHRLTDIEWHEARYRDSIQDEDDFGARWHLDRLIALEPDRELHQTRRLRLPGVPESRTLNLHR